MSHFFINLTNRMFTVAFFKSRLPIVGAIKFVTRWCTTRWLVLCKWSGLLRSWPYYFKNWWIFQIDSLLEFAWLLLKELFPWLPLLFECQLENSFDPEAATLAWWLSNIHTILMSNHSNISFKIAMECTKSVWSFPHIIWGSKRRESKT